MQSSRLLNPLVANSKAYAEEEGLASEATVETSFVTLLQSRPKVWKFMVVMGMISTGHEFMDCGFSKSFVLTWNYLLALLCILFPFVQLVETLLLQPYLSSAASTVQFVWVPMLAVQSFVILYGAFYIRKAVERKTVMNNLWYLSAFDPSLTKCAYVLVFISFAVALRLVLGSLDWVQSFNGASYHSYIVLEVFEALCSFAGIFLLVGCFFVLIVEQSVALNELQLLTSKVEHQSVTQSEYFRVRQLMRYRETLLPVDFIVFAAILNIIMGIAFVFPYIAITSHYTVWLWFNVLLIELALFGKEALLLIVLLYEVVRVNDLAQTMVNMLAEGDWGTLEKEVVRLSVLHAAVCRPIGSTIFYRKPTRNVVLIQILTTIVVTTIAVVRVYFMSKVEE